MCSIAMWCTRTRVAHHYVIFAMQSEGFVMRIRSCWIFTQVEKTVNRSISQRAGRRAGFVLILQTRKFLISFSGLSMTAMKEYHLLLKQ